MKDLDEIPDQCPTTEVLAAYLDRNLLGEEQSLLEKHLATCAKCRHIVAQVVKSEDSLEERSLPPDGTSFKTRA
jgi:anti-sigma factor RsiW